MQLSEDQIIKLAPDAASVKAGKGLASAAKWVLRGASDRALWGHCQGSGKNPYQTQVDLQNIAFKCSCPSHKFPCKHSLGLLFLYASQPDLFTTGEEPDWVKEWLEKRAGKAAEKKEKADKPVDVEAQAKRQEARHKKVLNGVDDLQGWLKDLVRSGLLNVPERAQSLFAGISKRMVDAQAPGLAGMMRQLQEIHYFGEDWKYELTAGASRAYLVAESYKHLDQLPPEWQDEVRTLVGYPQAKEEVLANGEQVSDDWLVVASESLQQDRLTVEYNWLYGRQTCRYALFLQFLTPGALAETALLPGSVVAADVAFYKGVTPTRVLFREQKGTREPFIPSGKGCCAGLAEAMQVYRESMTRNPFTYEVPVLVSEVRLVMHEKQVWIKDSDEYLIPLTLGEAGKLKGFAVTGGREFTGFFLAGERSWRVLSLWIEDKYYTLSNEYNG
jgi:hypothetical protein